MSDDDMELQLRAQLAASLMRNPQFLNICRDLGYGPPGTTAATLADAVLIESRRLMAQAKQRQKT